MRREHQNIEDYWRRKENEEEKWRCQRINGKSLIMRANLL